MSFYDTLRHFADSWALLVMLAIFVVLAGWPFRPGAHERNRAAANSIFRDAQDGEQ